MSLGLVLGLFIIAFFVLRKAIMIVPEGTVVKTFLLGKPDKSYSAGLHMGWFDPALYKQIRLKIGAIATATSATTIEIDGFQIPATFSDTPKIGSPVRIESFNGQNPVVTHRDVAPERTFRCEKCGHENRVRI